MKDISSASTAYSLVIFLVCLLLMVLYFCECGQNRGEMSSNFGSIETVVVAPTEFYKSKLLTRNEVSWPLLKSSQLKPSVAENSRTMRENSERYLAFQRTDGNESDVRQADKIFEGS